MLRPSCIPAGVLVSAQTCAQDVELLWRRGTVLSPAACVRVRVQRTGTSLMSPWVWT